MKNAKESQFLDSYSPIREESCELISVESRIHLWKKTLFKYVFHVITKKYIIEVQF